MSTLAIIIIIILSVLLIGALVLSFIAISTAGEIMDVTEKYLKKVDKINKKHKAEELYCDEFLK